MDYIIKFRFVFGNRKISIIVLYLKIRQNYIFLNLSKKYFSRRKDASRTLHMKRSNFRIDNVLQKNMRNNNEKND